MSRSEASDDVLTNCEAQYHCPGSRKVAFSFLCRHDSCTDTLTYAKAFLDIPSCSVHRIALHHCSSTASSCDFGALIVRVGACKEKPSGDGFSARPLWSAG